MLPSIGGTAAQRLPASLSRPPPQRHSKAQQSLRLRSTGRHNTMFFVLLATQSDPTLLYNDSFSHDESESRSRENLCGVTIVCVKRPCTERVTYRGLCMRSNWTRLERDTFDRLKSWLIFRDKCCNQRNFNNLIPMVNTTRRHHGGRRERNLPHGCQLLQSYYQYCRVSEYLLPSVANGSTESSTTTTKTAAETATATAGMECERDREPSLLVRRTGVVALPLQPNRYFNGLAGPPSNERYSEFYAQILAFMRDELRLENKYEKNDLEQLTLDQVPIFHKLPSWLSSWFCADLLALEPTLRFEYVGASISAKSVYTSPHCRYRVNHNASICEICLMDEYGAQLCNRVPTISATRLDRQNYSLTSASSATPRPVGGLNDLGPIGPPGSTNANTPSGPSGPSGPNGPSGPSGGKFDSGPIDTRVPLSHYTKQATQVEQVERKIAVGHNIDRSSTDRDVVRDCAADHDMEGIESTSETTISSLAPSTTTHSSPSTPTSVRRGSRNGDRLFGRSQEPPLTQIPEQPLESSITQPTQPLSQPLLQPLEPLSLERRSLEPTIERPNAKRFMSDATFGFDGPNGASVLNVPFVSSDSPSISTSMSISSVPLNSGASGDEVPDVPMA